MEPNHEPGKIFVGGLKWITSKEKLKEHFEQFGEVTDSVIMIDPNTNNPRGFGFVTMKDPSIVGRVCAQEHILDNKKIDPKPAVMKNALPHTATAKVGQGQYCPKKIFIGGVGQKTTEKDIRDYFTSFGAEVTEVDLKQDEMTERNKGYGFVTFASESAVDSAVEKHFHQIKDKTVEAKRAETKGSSSSRNYSGYQHNQYNSGANMYRAPDYGVAAPNAGYGSYGAYQQQPQQQHYSYGECYNTPYHNPHPGPTAGYSTPYNTAAMYNYNRYSQGTQQQAGAAPGNPSRMDYGQQQQQMAGYPQQDGRSAFHTGGEGYGHAHHQQPAAGGYPPPPAGAYNYQQQPPTAGYSGAGGPGAENQPAVGYRGHVQQPQQPGFYQSHHYPVGGQR